MRVAVSPNPLPALRHNIRKPPAAVPPALDLRFHGRRYPPPPEPHTRLKGMPPAALCRFPTNVPQDSLRRTLSLSFRGDGLSDSNRAINSRKPLVPFIFLRTPRR